MIKDIFAIPIWNNLGGRTFKVVVKTDQGNFSASAPAGESRGRWEAAYADYGRAAAAFPELKQALMGMQESEWDRADNLIERAAGRNFEKTGAQLSIATSMAVVRAAALGQVWQLLDSQATRFPLPVGNVAGGGMHGGRSMSIQEILIIPARARSMEEAIQTNFDVWNEVGRKLAGHGKDDEGAWISGWDDVKTLDVVSSVAESRGCALGVDIAANSLWQKGKYVWEALGQKFDASEQLEFVKLMAEKYKLVYIEDPFRDDDLQTFAALRKKTKAMIVVDDLTGTQPTRVAQAAQQGSAGGVIIKPDQAGTVSKALRAIDQAKNGKMAHIVSHRAAETNDTFIADMAVGTGAPLIKCGIAGGERVAKLNRLMEIWAAISERTKPEVTRIKFG